MSEWPSKWIINQSTFDISFTFDELHKQNITSQELYRWSAPMDIIEDYQFYLNQLSATNELPSMAKQLFYNCTLPRFGSLCQYSLDIDNSNGASLNTIIDHFYSQRYEPTTMTCYTHLECDRGSVSSCLDWTEICDGNIDCLNDGVDETDCWQVEINECKENEYRCNDGQCIPNIFVDDDINAFDCIDRSDEQLTRYHSSFNIASPPSFTHEDVKCSKEWSTGILYSSSCVNNRHHLIFQAMFLNKPDTIKDDCWYAFICYFRIPDSSHPRCHDICFNRTCQQIINDTCPEMFYIPNVPIFFGHIYLAYTKKAALESINQTLPPSYICYNDQLCDGFSSNSIVLSYNNSVCRRPEDFSLSFSASKGSSWMSTYSRPIFKQLYKCKTKKTNNFTFCDKSIMYQCINSSKCILHVFVGDGIKDCNYGDDEEEVVINDICLKYQPKTLFKCTITNTCIFHDQVRNGICDCECDDFGLCDDETMNLIIIKRQLPFQYFCDGITDLSPITIDGRNETDETECESWQCINTYSRCDGDWHCPNGADEVDCNPLSSLQCLPHHHICISIETKQPMCLPLEKANDGKIDCLEAADEPRLCQSNDSIYFGNQIDCLNYTSLRCTMCQTRCLVNSFCELGSEEDLCYKSQYFIGYRLICMEKYNMISSNVETILSNRPSDNSQLQVAHYSVDDSENSVEEENIIIPFPAPMDTTNQYKQRCHRGIPLLVWTNTDNNSTNITCLCPPSFYGSICQYQNQRVSLTLKFEVYSDCLQTVFAIVISLIDDSKERIIHSYQQFSYLYIRDCYVKFNTYLLYSTRPKNQSKHYSVHIDIYEKISLTYRGSLLIPLTFPFLPVHRIAARVNIPNINENFETCTNQPCVHGKCMRYSEHLKRTTFCHCNQGWSGRYCDIPYRCICSPDSLCIGVSTNNRSICVCPLNKFGSRCLLDNTICQSNRNDTCYNGGKCVPTDEHSLNNKNFFCICPTGFTGYQCEKPMMKIIVSFHQDIELPQSMIIHFLDVPDFDTPKKNSLFKTIPMYQRTVTIHWANPFELILMQLFNMNLYIVGTQQFYNESTIIEKRIDPLGRCKHLREVLNDTIVNLHRIRRVKYYHIPCQQTSPLLECFFDDTHFCMCVDVGQSRAAKCFEFDYQSKFDCFGQNYCENGAQCFQEKPYCPQTSMCACSQCFYGARCEFSTTVFGLSLDAILGYHIQPHLAVREQPSIVKVSMALTIIMTVAGLLSGGLSMITFKNKRPRTQGTDLYLFGSSISTLFTTAIFASKFWILLLTQMALSTHKSFLDFQCISIDFLLRIGLNMDQWLSACVAVERAITAGTGIHFNRKKSRIMARYIILGLLTLTIGTNIHDPISRRLIHTGNVDEEQRIWCIVTYSSNAQLYNSIMHMFHFIAPFVINLISAAITIQRIARIRNIVHPQENVQLQMQRHSHILIAPVVLIILAIPRIILSLVSGCMKSVNDAWLFLIGYYISFIPSMLTFVVFVLPSKSYKKELHKAITRYRTMIWTSFNIRF